MRGKIRHTPGESSHGMVLDFSDLADIVNSSVISKLDHYNLNEVTGIYTTAENLAHWIWDALVAGGLQDEQIARIRLWETATGYVEITPAERGEQ